jgi:hypothetical protein
VSNHLGRGGKGLVGGGPGHGGICGAGDEVLWKIRFADMAKIRRMSRLIQC